MKLTINIESDNAAFDDGAGGRGEAVRILADLAGRMGLMPDGTFDLRDANGHKVGTLTVEWNEDDA